MTASDKDVADFLYNQALPQSPDYLSHVYKQGYDAAKRGLHPADCPFEIGTKTADKWFEGWSDKLLEAA